MGNLILFALAIINLILLVFVMTEVQTLLAFRKRDNKRISENFSFIFKIYKEKKDLKSQQYELMDNGEYLTINKHEEKIDGRK
tara:strand:- start:131 stop:379 length:249 start_codon:yes stop_codon:yes gene_type:complete